MNRRTLQIVLATLLVLIVGAGCQPKPSKDAFQQPRIGSTASFQSYPRWGIAGTVTVVDARTLRFDDFSFHGEGLPVVIALQQDLSVVARIKDITSDSFDHASFTLAIPDGIIIDDFNLVTVYSSAHGTPVSGAAFSAS